MGKAHPSACSDRHMLSAPLCKLPLGPKPPPHSPCSESISHIDLSGPWKSITPKKPGRVRLDPFLPSRGSLQTGGKSNSAFREAVRGRCTGNAGHPSRGGLLSAGGDARNIPVLLLERHLEAMPQPSSFTSAGPPWPHRHNRKGTVS